MNPGQVSALLAERNPWWGNTTWQDDDPDLKAVRAARFNYRPDPLAGIAPDNLYVLRGPRRVGKTVEVKRAIAALLANGVHPRRVIFAACKGLSTGDLRNVVTMGRDHLTSQETEPRFWFFDEITGIRGSWPALIADLRDNNAGFKSDCVVLSGSSAADLQEATKLLAGRRGSTVKDSNRTLLPMGFRSFCAAVTINVPAVPVVRVEDMLDVATNQHFYALVPALNRLITSWESYLLVGGYPQGVDEYLKFGAVSPAFVNALTDVIVGDALVGKRRAGRTELISLLTQLALALTNPVNLSTLQGSLGFASHHTVTELIRRLISSFITWPCYQEAKFRPNLNARYKLYFTDPLLARIPSLQSPTTVVPPDSSLLSEQAIGAALVRQLEQRYPGTIDGFGEILYMTTPTRKEIDFVGGKFRGFGYEGKYVDQGTKQEAQTLFAQFQKGLLLTRGVLDLSDPVVEVPASFVGYLLDRGA